MYHYDLQNDLELDLCALYVDMRILIYLHAMYIGDYSTNLT